MSSYQIDQIDQKILSFLVKNARMPFLEIARECGVSGAAIHQRVKRLETNGVITGSQMLVERDLRVCRLYIWNLLDSIQEDLHKVVIVKAVELD